MAGKVARWGIVGGGFLGMTLALRLRQRGHEVTLLERADHLGGLASAWRIGDVVWDRHYHVILLSDLRLRGLLRELGLESEVVWGETRTGFYVDGRLHPMSSVVDFLRFPPLDLWSKFRLGATIWYASKIRDGRPLEAIPVADWLYRLSGRRTTERIWLPLLRSKLGDGHRDASASFLWAIIARLYAARRTGLKREMFGYVAGGYARVLERFGEHLGQAGVRVELGQTVSQVDSCERGARVSRSDAPSLCFDRVVITSPSPTAAALCPGLAPDEAAAHRRVRYQGIVCASVLSKVPLAGNYVTNITDDWVPFTGVIETSSLVDRSHFGGHHLVYLPKYVPPDDPLFAKSDDEVRASFLAALGRMYPHFQETDVVAFRVSRVRHVLPVPTLHYSRDLPPMSTTVPGVSIVNSAQIVNGTLNVNETIQLAETALDRLLGEAPGAPR